MNIKREEKIFLNPVGDGVFSIEDRDGRTLKDGSDEYFIYFKNVNFREDGRIDGRYLGENPTTIIDNQSKEATFIDGSGYEINGTEIRTARLVAVRNKSKVIVIIAGDYN